VHVATRVMGLVRLKGIAGAVRLYQAVALDR
jgi:hypothetical protein